MSAGLDLIKLTWTHAGEGRRGWSWQLFNQAVWQSCQLAAESFKWEKGDIEKMLALANRRYSIVKCLPSPDGLEWLYSIAVKADNISFIEEYERWLGRPPLIVDGVDGKQKGRLHLGATFTWYGQSVEVTSMAVEYAVACSYKTVEPATVCKSCGCCRTYETRKVAKRYRIDREAILAERAERRKRDER